MDRVTAETTMSILAKLNKHISDMTELIAGLPDAESQRQLRRPLGDLMGIINVDMMRAIVHSYPDLNPDSSDG